LARTGGRAAAELSTTLVVALVSAGGGAGAGAGGEATAVLARVGDSTAFSLSAGSDWQEIFSPEAHGELRTTATDVLPLPGRRRAAAAADGPGVAIEVASVQLGPGTALVLVTDGVANPLRDGPSTVAPALASVLAAGARGQLSPLELAHATDFSRRGALDDRTLLVVWPRPAS
jgi:serine/threonine protein phosphatase PrpC